MLADPSTPPAPDGLRARLLAEAVAILGREGGRGLTVRRVAAAAGCSTIGVYTHFAGKSGLVEAVILDGFDDLDAATGLVDDLVDPVARLIAGAHAYRDWALRNPVRYQVMFDALVPDVTWTATAGERGERSFGLCRARVGYAQASGAVIDGDLDVLAHHVWATLHGHVVLAVQRGTVAEDRPERDDFERAMGWLLRGLSRRPAGSHGASVDDRPADDRPADDRAAEAQ